MMITSIIFSKVQPLPLQRLHHKEKEEERKRKYVDRTPQKYWWSYGYEHWNIKQFKLRLRVFRETFNIILEAVGPHISKQPTNFKPHPIEDHRQIALTLCRLAHSLINVQHLS